jgi:hypothetical protein
MIFCAVFLIGFSTLAFEVLLTRIFSIGFFIRPQVSSNPHPPIYDNDHSVIYRLKQPSAGLFQATR